MNPWQEEIDRRRRDLAITDATKTAMLGGAGSGALLGGAGRMLSGSRAALPILKAAGIGALGAGALAGGSTYVGSQILGAPGEEEEGGFTTRGALGGMLSGGALGAGVGALLGSGKLGWMKKLPFAEKIASRAKANLPLDNVIVDRVKRWNLQPGSESAKKSAALLGGLGAALAGYSGADEGMQLDYLETLRERAKQKKLEEALGDF